MKGKTIFGLLVIAAMFTTFILSVVAEPSIPEDENGMLLHGIMTPTTSTMIAVSGTSARDSLGVRKVLRLYCDSDCLIELGAYTVAADQAGAFFLPGGVIDYVYTGLNKYIAAQVKGVSADTLFIVEMD